MKDFNELSNLYIPSPSEFKTYRESSPYVFKQEIKKEDIPNFTIVYRGSCFATQEYDGTKKNGYGIFYVQKYKKLFLYEEMCEFIENHPDEMFLLCNDSSGSKHSVFVFVESEDNQLKLSFYNNGEGKGKFEILAEMENVYGTTQMKEPIIYKPGKIDVSIIPNRYHRDYVQICFFEENEYGNMPSSSQFRLFNYDSDRMPTTAEIIKDHLQLPNQTRVVASLEYSGNYLMYKIDTGILCTASPTIRYGITNNEEMRDNKGRSLNFHPTIRFPEADLPKETFERIKEYITNILNGPKAEPLGLAFGCISSVVTSKGVLVISEPVSGHKRPTYHYIRGFKKGTALDIIELARGELLIKDMIPVNCYYLNADTGEYCQVSHHLLGSLKKDIIDQSEVDKVSLAQWTEEKSMHPELIKSILGADAHNDILLHRIKLFNRVPFGALFLEQIIKAGKLEFAISFAEFIMQRADNMNYSCGSLDDILPGCNPEGTSLAKILNFSKPCMDLFMREFTTEKVDNFTSIYKAIKAIAPDSVLTKERQKLITQYLELWRIGWTRFICGTGRTVDIIDHPEEIKSLYKMINRIRDTFGINGADYDVRRSYMEIVSAYFQFVDFGWDPAESKIFIEFSLAGENKEAIKNMIRDREHAANTALAIYRDKINEENHRKVEAHYTYRKTHALKKLEMTEPAAGTKKSAFSWFRNDYVIISPSQIYGKHTVGSIEKEGSDMEHCVFRSYADQIANGSYTVMYLRKKDAPEESLVTIGITKDGRINQTFGKNDCTINSEEAMAIAEWAQAKCGLVTFVSEHNAVVPGGWNRSVGIPTLEKANKEWLAKLARIE